MAYFGNVSPFDVNETQTGNVYSFVSLLFPAFLVASYYLVQQRNEKIFCQCTSSLKDNVNQTVFLVCFCVWCSVNCIWTKKDIQVIYLYICLKCQTLLYIIKGCFRVIENRSAKSQLFFFCRKHHNLEKYHEREGLHLLKNVPYNAVLLDRVESIVSRVQSYTWQGETKDDARQNVMHCMKDDAACVWNINF